MRAAAKHAKPLDSGTVTVMVNTDREETQNEVAAATARWCRRRGEGICITDSPLQHWPKADWLSWTYRNQISKYSCEVVCVGKVSKSKTLLHLSNHYVADRRHRICATAVTLTPNIGMTSTTTEAKAEKMLTTQRWSHGNEP